MEDIISNSKNKILIKHNTLVAARYNLTPNECRVFTYLLYKIQMDVSLGSEKSSTITQDEFKFLISDKNKRSIKGITNILKSLKKNDIYLKEKKREQIILYGVSIHLYRGLNLMMNLIHLKLYVQIKYMIY